MMNRQFTRDELQQAFALAFVFIPSTEVALRVLIRAMKLATSLEQTEARRQRSMEHYKSPIPAEALLQFAVLFASLKWEVDQESPLPKKEPRYKPTRDDRVVRYVKHLVCNNLLRTGFSSLGIGLGCLLYDYKPKRIADLLGLSDELSIRRIKSSIKKQLMKRFKYAEVLTPKGNAFRTTLANDYDRELVQQTLKALTPWNTTHIPLALEESLLEKLVYDESTLTDWDRKHALLDSDCGGLYQLIIQHNNLFARYGEELEDPNLRLFVPAFPGSPIPPVDRFKAPRLTDNEILLLNEQQKSSGSPADGEDDLLSGLYEYGADQSLIEVFDDSASSTNASPPLRVVSHGSYAKGSRTRIPFVEERGDAMASKIMVIGIGGTGAKVLAALHRLALEMPRPKCVSLEADLYPHRGHTHFNGDKHEVTSERLENVVVGQHAQLGDTTANQFSNLRKQRVEESLSQKKIKILFLAANPIDTSHLRLREEIRQIEERTRIRLHRDAFELISQQVVRVSDLQRIRMKHQPDIIHFSGHGSETNEIILEDKGCKSRSVSRDALSALFRVLEERSIVLLNACFSKIQGEALGDNHGDIRWDNLDGRITYESARVLRPYKGFVCLAGGHFFVTKNSLTGWDFTKRSISEDLIAPRTSLYKFTKDSNWWHHITPSIQMHLLEFFRWSWFDDPRPHPNVSGSLRRGSVHNHRETGTCFEQLGVYDLFVIGGHNQPLTRDGDYAILCATLFLKASEWRKHGPSPNLEKQDYSFETHGDLAVITFHSMEPEQLDLEPFVPKKGSFMADRYDRASARKIIDRLRYSPQIGNENDAVDRWLGAWGETSLPLWGMNSPANRANLESNIDVR